MTTGIYGIKNKINDKFYVGQSVNIKRRWNSHRNPEESNSHYPLYRAIAKYGIDNFEFLILEETLVSDLTEREKFWIEKLDSFSNGYNQTPGGETGALIKVTWDQVEEITEILKTTNLTQTEIGNLFNISSEMINGLNTGRFYKRDISYPIRDFLPGSLGRKPFIIGDDGARYSKCIDCDSLISCGSTRCWSCHTKSVQQQERPTPEWLLKNVAERGFTDVGREFGVTGNTIKKWCVAYNLPHLLPEIQKLYGNYIKKVKILPQPPDRIVNIRVERNGNSFVFDNTSEMAEYIIDNRLSSAKRKSIVSGCYKLVSGRRQSYLGFKVVK